MCGGDRAVAYRLAIGTGFRARELASLTPESFDLDADTPTVTVIASHSKRRRDDVQPIRCDLAELLRPWLKNRPRGEPILRLPERTAKMLRADLQAARDTWIQEAANDRERTEREKNDFLASVDAEGRIVDFHSVRHTYITAVVNGGASVKVAQELARHSTPTLTIGRYSHTRIHDLTRALESLPDLSTSPETAEMRATGTFDMREKCGHFRRHSERQEVQNHAKTRDKDRKGYDEKENHKCLHNAALSEDMQVCATEGKNEADGNRTRNLRIDSPML